MLHRDNWKDGFEFCSGNNVKGNNLVYLKMLPHNFPAENEKNCKKRVSIDGTGQKLEHVISRM
jgi:hypothetical protein